MSAFGDALAATPTRRGATCTLGVLLETLPDDDREDLEAAVDDPRIPGTQISKALATLDLEIAAETVLRHRKRGAGGCKCPR